MRLVAILAVVLFIFFGLMPAKPVMAAIAQPTSLSIDQVEVYRNALELNDQLYLITYTIEYGVNPTEGTAKDLYLVRLLNGGVELGSVPCSAFFDDGYDTHVISIYFDSASAPAWDVAYTMYLQGNPTLDWAGGVPPSTNMNTFSLWYDGGTVAATSTRLTIRLRVVAQDLESDWGGATDLIEIIATGAVLTAEGEEYFSSVINKLRTITPDLFADSMVAVSYTEEVYTQTYATTLATRLLGTLFDTTNAAAGFSLSRMWFNSLVWFFLVIAPIGLGVIKFTASFRPVLLVTVVLVPVGALAGFIPLLVAVGLTFALGLIIIYAYFYQKTG